ncbi:tetraspanin-9-like isoform X1 [Scylla paramamosain]|uniref:tetraspanin-9-like isoform X1 n=1 Tax=Scylla paramamosain TaxID=85552 RepID=UPI0030838D82
MNMANAVLTSFPAILRNSDLEEHELQLQWKLRIQRKFQNSRKRQDSSVTEVMSRKKKIPCIAPKETTCPLMYGVKAYLPPRPHSEDDESLERHRQWLALHWMKKDPELDKGTGIAVGYTGASLLSSYVAYLSPWVPAWLWLAVGSVMVLGVMITAISTVGAISTLAPNPKAFKMCLSLLLMVIVTEMGTTMLEYQKKALFLNSLTLHMKQEMEVSEAAYGVNISDTQMWDEIQLEMNCCGTEDYEDWFDTTFGNGTDVPDSCCLLISEGCGKGIKNDVTPEDDIETQGCLPTIIDDLKRDGETLSRGVWLPVCAMHVALLVLLLATSVFLHEGYTDSNFPGVL